MLYRFLHLTTDYPQYLCGFHERRPWVKNLSYELQLAELNGDFFGSADFWSVALARLGHQTGDVIANAEPMQKRWADDHAVRYTSSWLLEISFAQVKAFQPDVVLISDLDSFPKEFIRRLRLECPALRLVLGWCGAPLRNLAVLQAYDLVLSNVPELIALFGSKGARCHHLHHAFEPRVLSKLCLDRAPTTDFSFIGSIVPGRGFHNSRLRLLGEIVPRTNLQIWGNVPSTVGTSSHGIWRTPRAWLRQAIDLVRGRGWQQVSPETVRQLLEVCQPPVFGVDMFQQLRDSKVTLNTHIDISSRNASNMRLFEATGVGSCLLTDWKENLPELFEPDTEVVTYGSAAECIEKVKYLLEHETARQALAAAGQRRTLRCHTFDHRARQMNDIIFDALQARSPVRMLKCS